MSVSKALEKSARDFCSKYTCQFDFASFESSVEEFTFLRPVGGWVDVYKSTFHQLYKNALENAAIGVADHDINAEAMLDDFEYTLIRPYVNDGERDIKHKPYVGMDRITRLEYLDRLTREAPSNLVALYEDKYKSGVLSIQQMRAEFAPERDTQEHYAEIAGFVQALENTNRSRSSLWRVLHPLKNRLEKRESALMKKLLVEELPNGEEGFREATETAYEVFDGYQRVNDNLALSMRQATEEMNRKQKMNDVMRESIRIEGFDKDILRERSPKIEAYREFAKEKQI